MGDLGDRSGVTGSTLTHHLKILATAGLVVQSKQGRSIICAAVAYDDIKDLSAFLLRECCADSGEGHLKD
jgi:DNA-binding transcriptional ArsR family regulator